MKVKIKSNPEDFIVKEAASLDLKDKGDFGVYLLEKRGWNTVDLLLRLSRELGMPFKDFSYAGRKDRHGLTFQHITIKGPRRAEVKEKDYSLRFLGFMDRPMGPDLIAGNGFEIAVRGLGEEEARRGLEAIEVVRRMGYPNYFDEQRFGSFDPRQGFFAEKVLKGHFEGALKIHLALKGHFRGDLKTDLALKGHFTGALKTDLAVAKAGPGKASCDPLARGPKAALALLRKIPRDELAMYFASYQAYVWNEVLRRIIKSIPGLALQSYKGSAGDYLFYTGPEEKDCRYLKDLVLPACAGKTKMPDELSAGIYGSVLEENGIKPAMFNKLKLRQAFFKAFPRPAVVKPVGLEFEVRDDGASPGKKKLSLRFSLPRGSYGTMLVKRLFSFNRI